MGLEVLSSSSSELDFEKLEGLNECTEDEMNRIRRTGKASSRAIDQIDLPANDQLPPTKISSLPDQGLVNRVGQVAQNNGISSGLPTDNIDEILELLAENNEILADPTIPLSDEINALFPADEPEADKRNFLLQVNQLVAEIMQLLSKLSDRNRKKTDHMKKEYNSMNDLAAASIKNRGAWGLGAAMLGLGATLVCSFTVPGVSQAAGGVAQSIGNLFATREEATTSRYSNKINLINTELQNTASKSGDNSGWKQELIQALNDVKEWMRASVRTNG